MGTFGFCCLRPQPCRRDDWVAARRLFELVRWAALGASLAKSTTSVVHLALELNEIDEAASAICVRAINADAVTDVVWEPQ